MRKKQLFYKHMLVKQYILTGGKMTLDTFNTIEIDKRLSKISDITSMDISFERDLRLQNELFMIKAIVDSWKFNIDYRIDKWEERN